MIAKAHKSRSAAMPRNNY